MPRNFDNWMSDVEDLIRDMRDLLESRNYPSNQFNHTRMSFTPIYQQRLEELYAAEDEGAWTEGQLRDAYNRTDDVARLSDRLFSGVQMNLAVARPSSIRNNASGPTYSPPHSPSALNTAYEIPNSGSVHNANMRRRKSRKNRKTRKHRTRKNRRTARR